MFDVLKIEDTDSKDDHTGSNHQEQSDKESKWMIFKACDKIHSKDRTDTSWKADGQVQGFHVQIQTDDAIAYFILKTRNIRTKGCIHNWILVMQEAT